MEAMIILSLADNRATLNTVGGKGASLAKLVNAGLPVPNGFHITTAAYQQFVTENALQPRILAALRDVDVAQPASLEAASDQIRALFIEAPIPSDLTEAIRAAYLSLSAAPVSVAIRSSATAEDLPDASFAGQQDTYLNIQGVDAVLDAVRRCWSSLWTARAIGYRMRRGIDPDAVSLAIVVQLLIFAEAAGILFTANPLNGRREQLVINAAWGLGEAIVGGLVTPDTYTVAKATGQLLNCEVADKQVMTIRTEQGTEERPVAADQRQAQVLDATQIAELARLAREIEALYGTPQDIEWCWAEGRSFIVQARPITTLPPTPVTWEAPAGDIWMRGGGIMEFVTEPVSPLGITWVAPAFDRANYKLGKRFGIHDLTVWPLMHFSNGHAFIRLRPTPKPKHIFALYRALRAHARSLETWPQMLATYQQTVARLSQSPPEILTPRELWQRAQDLLAAGTDYWNAVGMIIRAVLQREGNFSKFYRRVQRSGDPTPEVLLRGHEMRPYEAECSIYALAQSARDLGLADLFTQTNSEPLTACAAHPGGVTFLAQFQAHLEAYGYQFSSIDPLMPTLSDDPQVVLLALRGYLQGQEVPSARLARMTVEREAALAALETRLPSRKFGKLTELLAQAREGARERETAMFEFGLAWRAMRRDLRELGRRLVAAEALAAPDDIYFLTEKEIGATVETLEAGQIVASLLTIVAQRRADWESWQGLQPPTHLPEGSKPVWWWKYITPVPEVAPQVEGNTLTGLGVSPGKVTGIARVLATPGEIAHFQAGDILVAHITTPAWTPLFTLAGGVVTDLGGALSHGGIVAREYGLPAVTGVGIATQRIRDGQTITVDGNTGRITLHKDAHAIEWTLPNPKSQYMHAGIADLMPNPVSPLFETLAIPTIARVGVKEVLRPLTRSEPILPDYIVTLNSYVYINAGYTLKEWWWILSRMMTAMPRMLREAIPLWRDKIRPQYVAAVTCWQSRAPETLSLDELWAGIQELNTAAMLHFSALLVATTGASAGAEMLFTNVYNKLLRRTGDPEASVFLMGYDSTPIQAEKSLYDLAEWIRTQPELGEHFLSTPTADLVAHLLPATHPVLHGWDNFCERLKKHLNAYGHLIYDLDFARLLPADDPTPMLETIKMYLRGGGINPHERQQATAERREQAVEEARARLKGLRRWAFEKTLKPGQAMAQVREDALADIGLGYPALRGLLRELGRRCAQAGAIAEAEDIFWLQADEMEASMTVLASGSAPQALLEEVAQRKAHHSALARIVPPPTLPPRKKYLGINMEPFTAASETSQEGDVLKGIGASAGKVTAPACVLHGPEDFDQMRPGCILVAGTTTPAWTPLFAMAAAVVTDIGGPLSHGSIVAREYGIPAVMGTGVATRRIKNGQMITIDGSEGYVELMETLS
ncbi:MAG: hypothetical protein JW892_12785 [Anaerolineae bacterium]|nr:hypothetical protein [Anaerolineae bacterium]